MANKYKHDVMSCTVVVGFGLVLENITLKDNVHLLFVLQVVVRGKTFKFQPAQ